MESLYRKYRPQTFADVVGQQHVVNTLEHAVQEGRLSHAYLFCGPRGTGKTTMARLLAKALMCKQGAGHLPDGTCEQCALIAAGEHPDVYELDAASRTGVEAVREEIISRVNYAPVQGSFKVYIIDEVHMLSVAAFNALLKTLEEPPGHVVFVLCTTDPQKIPETILSRVQRFDFRPIGNADVLAQLIRVCEQEGFTYEDEALEIVVRNAHGGMRDALSMLEQLSVFGGGVIDVASTRDMLGAVSGESLGNVVRAMANRDIATLFAQVAALVDSGQDLLQFTRELAARIRDVYVVAVVGADPEVLPAGCDVAVLQGEAQQFGPHDRLARILTLLGDVSREMSTAPNQRLVLEIAFTRVARPESDITLESLAERISVLEQGGGAVRPYADTSVAPVAVTPAPAASAQTREQPVSQPVTQPMSQPVSQPESQPNPQPTKAKSPDQPMRRESQQTQAPQEAPKPAPAQTTTDPGALQRAWRQAVKLLMERVPSRGTLLSSATALSDDGTKLVIGLPKGSTFALKMLEQPDIRAIIEKPIFDVFGNRQLVFQEGGVSGLRTPGATRSQPATQPTPVTQPVSMSQPAPSPRPEVTPQPTVNPQPAPTPQMQPQPTPQPVPQQPQPQRYAMPWDEVEPVVEADEMPPADAYFESVPYEQIDAGPYEPDPQPEPVPQPDPQPTSVPRQKLEPQPSSASQDEFASQQTPPSVPEAQPEPAQTPSVEPLPDQPPMPDDLPPELLTVLENAFEVFGTDTKVSKKE